MLDDPPPPPVSADRIQDGDANPPALLERDSRHTVGHLLRTTRHVLRDCWDRMLDSAAWRAVFFLLSTVLSGVLSGAFIAEITINGKLAWGVFYTAPSFWALGSLSVLLYAYQRALFHRETHVSRFADKDYCLAYMRAQCLPEAAQRYKERIRNGDGREFEEAMAVLRRTLR
jgi:hypothetical protein